jgi:hypothetical protein
MRFHFGSFLLGFGAGAATVLVGRHLRPVLVEVASAGYQFADALAARVAMVQEDFEDVLAEAKARARGEDVEPADAAEARA